MRKLWQRSVISESIPRSEAGIGVVISLKLYLAYLYWLSLLTGVGNEVCISTAGSPVYSRCLHDHRWGEKLAVAYCKGDG